MPQQAWSNKRERQYKHIKQGAKRRGRPEATAERIAAATVNKTRRQAGETKSGRKSTTGTGNPNARLHERSRQELYNRAKKLHIQGRSKMNKGELAKAIRDHV